MTLIQLSIYTMVVVTSVRSKGHSRLFEIDLMACLHEAIVAAIAPCKHRVYALQDNTCL